MSLSPPVPVPAMPSSSSDPPPPSYPDQPVPSYSAIDEALSPLHEPASPALGDFSASSSSQANPQSSALSGSKFYFQREEPFPSRHALIVTCSADPLLCRPVYTLAHHGQFMNILPGNSQPDLTLYRGSDTHGQVVATGTVRASILSKTVATVKLFNSSLTTITIRKDGDRCTWLYGDRTFAWSISVTVSPPANAGEHKLLTPPVSSGTSRLRRLVETMPEVLFNSYRGVLCEADKPGVDLAVYQDISPHNPPITRKMIWKDGHTGLLEFSEVGMGEFQDAALAVLVVMIERARRAVANGKSGSGYTFNSWGMSAAIG